MRERRIIWKISPDFQQRYQQAARGERSWRSVWDDYEDKTKETEIDRLDYFWANGHCHRGRC